MSKMTNSKAEWLNSFASGKIWLNKINSANTSLNYVDTFKIYCDWAKKTPDEILHLKRTPLEFAIL